MSTFFLISGSISVMIARNWRLIWFLCTAPPNAFVTSIPTREFSSRPVATTMTESGCAYDLPVWRTRLKSFDWVNRNFRFTRHPVQIIKEHAST